MRIGRVEWEGEPRTALVTDEGVRVHRRDLAVDELHQLELPGEGWAATIAVEDATFLVPVREAGKIIGIGLNYRDHAAEAAADAPSHPLLFAKTNNTLLGHKGVITYRKSLTKEVDFEGELAVVVGSRARRVTTEQALGHVLGYTVANDVSARDVQFGDGQWMRGKSMDTFCPLGPVIVSPAHVVDPQCLEIVTTVNGTVMQRDTTANMIFGVAEIISFVSHSITLEPGDVILTGTPAGVGFARQPPVFLCDGDLVTVSIETVGVLENAIAAEDSAAEPTSARTVDRR